MSHSPPLQPAPAPGAGGLDPSASSTSASASGSIPRLPLGTRDKPIRTRPFPAFPGLSNTSSTAPLPVPQPAEQPLRGDPVQATSTDAAISKLSCVRLGYYSDPYLQHFVPPARASRRPPLIHRGYWARVAAVWRSVHEFLAAGETGSAGKQLVSLGAGDDTTYFRLKAAGLAPDLYVEIDFPQAMEKKAHIIDKQPDLQTLLHATRTMPTTGAAPTDSTAAASASPALSDATPSASSLSAATSSASSTPASSSAAAGSGSTAAPIWRWSSDYALLGVDMRHLDSLHAACQAAGVDFTKPTLFLAECVLVYMKPEESQRVIAWTASEFTGGSFFVSYEQILPHDAFGRTMRENLEQRGCSLLGFLSYPDIASHRDRYLACGYTQHAGWDMNDIYQAYVPKDEVRRIERLEMFDEFEEWHLIHAHYHFSMAIKPPTGASSSSTTTSTSTGMDWNTLGLLGTTKPVSRQKGND